MNIDTDDSLIANVPMESTPPVKDDTIAPPVLSTMDDWAIACAYGLNWPDAFPMSRDGIWTTPRFKIANSLKSLANEADDPDVFAEYLAGQGWDFDLETVNTKVTYRGVDIHIAPGSGRTTEFIATVAIVEMLGRVRRMRTRNDSFIDWKHDNEATALAAIHPVYPDAEYIDSYNADAQTVKCIASGVKNYRLAISTRNKEPVFQPCDIVTRAAPSQGVYVVTERSAEDHAVTVYDAIVALRETKPEAYAALLAIVVDMTSKKVAEASAAVVKEKAVRAAFAALTMAELVADANGSKEDDAGATP